MRESKNLEFKEKVSNPFLKTVTAFSNYNGGKIIFGLNDQGEVVGIDNLEKEMLRIENKINDNITPQVDFSLSVDEAKKLIILQVEPGEDAPYYYKSKTFRRNDSSTIQVDRIELSKLILLGQNKTYDALPAKDGQILFGYLEKQFQEKLGVETVYLDVLKSLDLVDKHNVMTNAGYLLSDNNSRNILDIVRFGKSQDIIRNRYQINSCSLLEAYDRGVEIFRDHYQIEKIDGAYRRKIELVPEKAFREALANAIVHRDWMVDSYIQIAMEDEWIVITSPGGLPGDLTESEYLEGRISKMRNPIIGNIFFRLDIIESFGTGIRRIKNAYSHSSRKPIFTVYENSIEVKLPLISLLDELTEDERKVYYAIENDISASSGISEATGFGKNKVLLILNELLEDGYVKKIGRGRGTKYSIE